MLRNYWMNPNHDDGWGYLVLWNYQFSPVCPCVCPCMCHSLSREPLNVFSLNFAWGYKIIKETSPQSPIFKNFFLPPPPPPPPSPQCNSGNSSLTALLLYILYSWVKLRDQLEGISLESNIEFNHLVVWESCNTIYWMLELGIVAN
jgi:hypothetical protein